jgi:hypothetical protein
MRDFIPRLNRFFLFLALGMIVAASPAFAQGGATSTIAGTVTDTSGAVVPGADIVVKSVTTGTVYNAVSGSDGSFTIPAVPPGTYSVTVTLMGFKTAVLNDVIANVAQVANVKAVLTLGALEETVVVSGQHGGRGPARQLLRGEPRREQRNGDHQRAQHEIRRHSADLQPPVRRRLPGAEQLHLQQGLPERLLRVP